MELLTILGTTLIFFILFLIQVLQTCHMVRNFRADTRNLSQESEVSNYLRTSLSFQKSVSQAARRNVGVVFCSLVWLVLYDVPLNRDVSLITSSVITYIYQCRLVIVLDQLTTNIVLYFLFRNWYFFLCHPCRSGMSVMLVEESLSGSNVQLPFLDDEKEAMDVIKNT